MGGSASASWLASNNNSNSCKTSRSSDNNRVRRNKNNNNSKNNNQIRQTTSICVFDDININITSRIVVYSSNIANNNNNNNKILIEKNRRKAFSRNFQNFADAEKFDEKFRFIQSLKKNFARGEICIGCKICKNFALDISFILCAAVLDMTGTSNWRRLSHFKARWRISGDLERPTGMTFWANKVGIGELNTLYTFWHSETLFVEA